MMSKLQYLSHIMGKQIDDNVLGGVTNCLCTHEWVILVFISQVMKQPGE